MDNEVKSAQPESSPDPPEDTRILIVSTIKTELIGQVAFDVRHRSLNLPIMSQASMLCMVLKVMARTYHVTDAQMVNLLVETWNMTVKEEQAKRQGPMVGPGGIISKI